jgi:hypothetical protein
MSLNSDYSPSDLRENGIRERREYLMLLWAFSRKLFLYAIIALPLGALLMLFTEYLGFWACWLIMWVLLCVTMLWRRLWLHNDNWSDRVILMMAGVPATGFLLFMFFAMVLDIDL